MFRHGEKLVDRDGLAQHGRDRGRHLEQLAVGEERGSRDHDDLAVGVRVGREHRDRQPAFRPEWRSRTATS